jgi:hypothetical protein
MINMAAKIREYRVPCRGHGAVALFFGKIRDLAFLKFL